jgi:hypothetical protein
LRKGQGEKGGGYEERKEGNLKKGRSKERKVVRYKGRNKWNGN